MVTGGEEIDAFCLEKVIRTQSNERSHLLTFDFKKTP